MTKEETLKILKMHNEWRKGKETPMQQVESIGEALDKAIELLEGDEIKMNKQELKWLPVLINVGREAMTGEQIDIALKEWDKLFEYIEKLEKDNCR